MLTKEMEFIRVIKSCYNSLWFWAHIKWKKMITLPLKFRYEVAYVNKI